MKPIGRIIQPNLFPEVLPTVNTARPEFQWLIPYHEACKLPAGTLLYMEEHVVEERRYHGVLQRIGNALEMLPGTDMLDGVPSAVYRLIERNIILQDQADGIAYALNAFWDLPWYKRVWRAMWGQW